MFCLFQWQTCCFVCSICTGPANMERTGVTCCPHKGPPRMQPSFASTSGHQWNVGMLKLSGCPHAFGRLIYSKGHVCSHHLFHHEERVDRLMRHGSGASVSLTMCCVTSHNLWETQLKHLKRWLHRAQLHIRVFGIRIDLAAVWPWSTYFPTLSLSALICKMGAIIPTFLGSLQDCTGFNKIKDSKKACKTGIYEVLKETRDTKITWQRLEAKIRHDELSLLILWKEDISVQEERLWKTRAETPFFSLPLGTLLKLHRKGRIL